MLAAAAATGIVVGAALMLWLNAHAGKVQTRLNSNIEQYQSLQGHDQASTQHHRPVAHRAVHHLCLLAL